VGGGGGGGSWTGLGKHYSVFCTESTSENVFFIRKREKFAKNRLFMKKEKTFKKVRFKS